MTIPSLQPDRWLAQAREIARQLKTNPKVPDKDPLKIGIAFDDSVVNITLDRGTIARLETSELTGLIFGLVMQDRTAAEQVPVMETSGAKCEGAVSRELDTVEPLSQQTSVASPAYAAPTERCVRKDGEEQCQNLAAGGLRVNLHATQTIQKRYGKRVMLSLIFDLPVCLACFPTVTPANVMTDEQWRAFSKVAQQRNSGILADRAETEIVLCPFEDPEYVTLRAQIAKANDSQPGPSGPTT